MTDNTEALIRKVLENFSKLDYIKPDEIPNIPLYMDQVTTFMNKRLSQNKRHEDDKILTKTMINNYAKTKILPAPVKKKYSRNHVLLLIFIYYFKNLLSISDIQKILEPLNNKYFGDDAEISLSDLYLEVFRYEEKEIEELSKSVLSQMERSKNAFDSAENLSSADKDFLELFALICMLSYDVYVKKQLIEQLIDHIIDK